MQSAHVYLSPEADLCSGLSGTDLPFILLNALLMVNERLDGMEIIFACRRGIRGKLKIIIRDLNVECSRHARFTT